MKATVAVLPASFATGDQRPGLDVNVDFHTASTKCLPPDKRQWSEPRAKLMAFFAFFVAVGALSLTAEMQLLPRWASFEVRCSPVTLNIGSINYRSANRFYTMMKEMKTPDPPTFRNDHKELCNDHHSKERSSQYCLPITSQDDYVFCAGANSTDLFVRQSPLTLCRASVMHLLLSDVYEELLVNSHVNFIAEDDIANVTSITYDGSITIGGALDVALQRKGYHLFHDNSDWRVCVAPTHPLASHLYDPDWEVSNAESSVPLVNLISSMQQSTAKVIVPDTIKAHPHTDRSCTPDVLDAKSIAYSSSHRFYTLLQLMEALPAPVFRDDHMVLCNGNFGEDSKLPYCLPISTTTSVEFCTGADRIELLVRQSPSTLCVASVLHLLRADVVEELESQGAQGSLVVDGSESSASIEAVDGSNAYATYNGRFANESELKLSLLRKGYSLYYAGTWRVCVAPTHPLAVNLYNPEQAIQDKYNGPFLELVPRQENFTAEAASIGATRTKEVPESMAPTTSKTMTEAPAIVKTGCTPTMVNISAGESSGKFDSMLKSAGPLVAPRFHGEHEVLCDSDHRKRRAFGYCLPISGRKETPLCANADRTDILLRQSPGKQCLASVLHMLLKDVYEELKAVEFAPILTFGTLLGAVRDGGIIPFTEDVDIAYDGEIVDGGDLDDRLWRKGYHLFEFNIWRVCVAPTHPLASQLYDPALRIVEDYTTPYVDLYAMEQQFGRSWSMQELKARSLPNDRVVPFSHVSINGEQFDTVHDPNFILRSEYGADFMTPKPRN